MTAEKAFRSVQKDAERIRNDERQTIGTVSAGDVIRQGDLYIVALGKKPAFQLEPISERQLAPGTTQGSRHVVSGEAKLFTPDEPAAAELVNRLVVGATVDPRLVGPVFLAGSECELQHPEHGDFALPRDEWFLTVYQRAHADDVRRQQD